MVAGLASEYMALGLGSDCMDTGLANCVVSGLAIQFMVYGLVSDYMATGLAGYMASGLADCMV